MTTAAPGSPEFGLKLAMAGSSTVNPTPGLGAPLLLTTTLPLLAAKGSTATMLLFDQLVMAAAWPLKVTVPALAPKLVPVMVMLAPGSALDGDRAVMPGCTPNAIPLLGIPFTVTTTFPVKAAPAGTDVVMDPELQLVTVARAPSMLTLLLPWAGLKFAPVIVSGAPTVPEVADKLEIPGAVPTVTSLPAREGSPMLTLMLRENTGSIIPTVKLTPLLCSPPLLTTTLPVVTELGTVATMLESDQLDAVAVWPLKVTVPALLPKLLPAIVTTAPGAPLAGLRLLMVGTSTVKLAPLLGNDPAVTTTFPLAAPLGTLMLMLALDQLELLDPRSRSGPLWSHSIWRGRIA
jgi:hypothetical protein